MSSTLCSVCVAILNSAALMIVDDHWESHHEDHHESWSLITTRHFLFLTLALHSTFYTLHTLNSFLTLRISPHGLDWLNEWHECEFLVYFAFKMHNSLFTVYDYHSLWLLLFVPIIFRPLVTLIMDISFPLSLSLTLSQECVFYSKWAVI